jgi:hypothetical protein
MRFLKNFGVGIGIKALLALVQMLVSRRVPKMEGGITLRAIWKHDATKFGLFLGGFAGLYKAVDCSLKTVFDEESRGNAFISGAIAGTSILFLAPESRAPIAIYLFVRAVSVAVHAASHFPWFPKAIKNFQHSDTALMSLAACQILYAYIYDLTSLPVSYQKFLLAAGFKPRSMMELSATVGTARSLGSVVKAAYPQAKYEAFMTKARPALLTKWPNSGDVLALPQGAFCEVMHPGQGCFTHWATFVYQHLYKYSIRFYLPLNVTSTILFQRKRLLSRPLQVCICVC